MIKHWMGDLFFSGKADLSLSVPVREALILGTGRVWAIWSVCLCAAAFFVLLYIWSRNLQRSAKKDVATRMTAERRRK